MRSQQKALVRRMEANFSRGVSASTLVDMQEDYEHDPRRTLTSIVLLPEDISRIITEKIITPLQTIEPWQYFMPSSARHLTTKNIRTIDAAEGFTDTDVQKVDALFQRIVPQFPAFEFSLEDVILFPTSISVMAYTNDSYVQLIHALDKGLKDIGVPDNKTYVSDEVFCGNSTVCRFTKPPGEAFVAAVQALRQLKLGSFRVEKITLVTCNAVCHPASRTVINEYRLKP